MLDAASTAARIATLEQQVLSNKAELAALTAQRDQYKKLYLDMLELCRKLERGILEQKREKLPPAEEQLTMSLLALLLGEQPPAPPPGDWFGFTVSVFSKI